MNKETQRAVGVPLLVSAASFVVVIAGMRAATPIIVPFLLSVFIAIISAPPLFWLERRGLPRMAALLLVIIGVVVMLTVIGLLVGSSLDDFSRDLPAFKARLEEQMSGLLGWLAGHGVTLSRQRVFSAFNPGVVMNVAATMLNGLGGALGNAFLIFLTVIFILFETSSFPTKLHAALGDAEESLAYFKKFTTNVKRYLAIKTATSLATGVAITLWLLVLGVDYPLLWGLLAFLLNYVPNIGSIIAAVPVLLLAFVQNGMGTAIWVAIGYLVVNNVVGSMIEPRFMGRSLGLSTLVVFLSLVFWGWVLGPVGMFLSVPLTMTVKIALDSIEDKRWIAILLGSDAAAQAALAVSVSQSKDEPSGTEAKTSALDERS